MVEPVLLDNEMYTMHGELPDSTLRRVADAIEMTVDQMGIPHDQIVFCPKDVTTELDYIRQLTEDLGMLAKQIVNRQESGEYENRPDLKASDIAKQSELKASIKAPRPIYSFDTWDSLIIEEGSGNPIVEAGETGRIGVYDKRQLPTEGNTFIGVDMTEDELKDALLFDFYPRFMDSLDIAHYTIDMALHNAELRRQQLAEEGVPKTGQEAMDYLGEIAASAGAADALRRVRENLQELDSKRK
jgi:hypothetical protein